MYISSILALLLISSVLQVFAAGDKSEGLVFYYDYSETKGDSVPDLSGHGYNGKIVGDVKIVEDPNHGKVAKFKSGSYLELDQAKIKADGNIPTKAFSLLAWINVEAGGDQAIFNAWSADNTWLIHPEIRHGAGVYRWLLRAKGGNSIFDMRSGKPKANTWVHFAGTYDRERKPKGSILFIDGKPVGDAAGDLPVSPDWDKGARVGLNVDNNRPFVGMMDEISVWERGFSQEEIQEIIEKGLDGFLAVNPVEKLATTWATVKAKR